MTIGQGRPRHAPWLTSRVSSSPIRVPSRHQPVVSFTVKPKGGWMFLRITDPGRPCDPLGKAPFEDATYGGAIAYASPWFFPEPR